jgi:hypothetical protein
MFLTSTLNFASSTTRNYYKCIEISRIDFGRRLTLQMFFRKLRVRFCKFSRSRFLISRKHRDKIAELIGGFKNDEVINTPVYERVKSQALVARNCHPLF